MPKLSLTVPFAVGETVFTREWKFGETMSMEQAVEYATRLLVTP